MPMRFASGLSDALNATAAADEAVRQVTEQFDSTGCDVAWVFVSPLYHAVWSDLLARVQDRLGARVLLGGSGSGLIGAQRELEWVPGISILAARLPGVRLHPFVVSPAELDAAEPGGFWIDKVGISPETRPVFVLCLDALTVAAEPLIRQLSATYSGRPMVGGLVSGGNRAGEHLLFEGTTVHREGAVGVALSGDIVMETIVSPGCRPIGQSYVVTKAEDNVIWQLGGRPAFEMLHQALRSLTSEDRELAEKGSVMMGLVINEMQRHFGAGDFLIRQIVGLDPDVGALAIADSVQLGQTVQFHLRDAGTSRDELRRMLVQHMGADAATPPAGALMFNCVGRGRAFYGSSHHDLRTVHMFSGKVPIGGFFSNGEIGPAGNANLVHGYTASVGFFRPVPAPKPQRTAELETETA